LINLIAKVLKKVGKGVVILKKEYLCITIFIKQFKMKDYEEV